MDRSLQQVSVSYRPMTLADVPGVHEIDQRSFALPWSERSYRFELTENKNAIPWVAEAAPAGAAVHLVGMIVIWAILDEAHVATIASLPEYRGRGIGRGLLARGLLEAWERGARMAFLEVRRGNLVAQQLYQQFGFAVVGERLRYYKDNNEDALLMTLDPLEPQALRRLLEHHTQGGNHGA